MTETSTSSGTSKKPECAARVEKCIREFSGMPAFLADILTMLQKRDADMNEVSEKIRLDPGITTNLLRLANSAAFGGAQSISSLRDAVVRMGIRKVTDVVVTYHMAERLISPLEGYNLQPDELLRHSLWTAIASQEICRLLKMPKPDLLFTAGLLHAMGKIVLDPFVDENQEALLTLVRSENLSFDAAEKKVLGWTHAEVGSTILSNWRFPDTLVKVTRWQHDPDQACDFKITAYIVHIGAYLAYSSGVGCGIDGLSYRLSNKAIHELGMKKRDIEYVASQTLDQVAEIMDNL